MPLRGWNSAPRVIASGPWLDIRRYAGATYKDKLLAAVAFAAGEGGGYTIFCPAGTYAFTGVETLTLASVSNLRILGESGTVFSFAGGVLADITTGTEITFEGLAFSGAVTLNLTLSESIRVQDCQFAGGLNLNGVSSSGTVLAIVTRCRSLGTVHILPASEGKIIVSECFLYDGGTILDEGQDTLQFSNIEF